MIVFVDHPVCVKSRSRGLYDVRKVSLPCSYHTDLEFEACPTLVGSVLCIVTVQCGTRCGLLYPLLYTSL